MSKAKSESNYLPIIIILIFFAYIFYDLLAGDAAIDEIDEHQSYEAP